MPKVLGIDLGTTYSVIAHLDETGRPVTIRSAEGDLTTPSVVLFDGDDVIVGREGLRALSGEPDQVAECAKRDLGLKRFHKAVAGAVLWLLSQNSPADCTREEVPEQAEP